MCTVSETDKLCIIRLKEEEKATERDTVPEKEQYIDRQIYLIELSFTVIIPDNLFLFKCHQPR
jgi:hypothetical protein